MLCVAVISSCTSRERKIQTLVTENLSQTLDEPTSLKIQTISQPDSAFGLRYFTPKEKGLIFKSVKDATECLMERTSFMTAPDMNDAYSMTIADMEMQVSANLYGNLLGDAKKGAFSGPTQPEASTDASIRQSDGFSSTRTARQSSSILIYLLSVDIPTKRV